MTPWRARLAPGGLALLFLAAACRDGPERLVFEKAPVVLISIDTLRSDRLPVYGYGAGATPAIDALARDAILFERAYSHYPLTLPSHASILSGLLPPRHGVRDNVGYPFDAARHPTLARLFKNAGYDTAGMVSAYVLRRATGIADGFDVYEDGLVAGEGQSLDAVQRPGRETTRLAIDWLRARSSRPFFLFFHLYEPHAPYAPPEPFVGRFAEPYDGEVAAADSYVGQVLDQLRKQGLYDRSIIVVLSDHGEALGDHGGQTHGVFLYREALQVPLLLKLPTSRHGGTRVAASARLVDIFPTLLVLAGLDVPGNDGASLLELLSPSAPPRPVYSETFYPRLHFGWSELTSMIDDRFHFIQGPDPELYDLSRDSRESRNVIAAERRVTAALRAALAAQQQPLAPPAALDAETARQLAALGYLGASLPNSGGAHPDPKSQMAAIRTMEAAFAALDHGELEGAAAGFRTLLAANPGMMDIWSQLGLTLQRLGRHEEALSAFERARGLASDPRDFEAPIAASLLAIGNLDAAASHAELARQRDPAGAFDVLIGVALARHAPDEAMALMQEAERQGAADSKLRRRFALGLVSAGRPEEALTALGAGAVAGDPETRLAVAAALHGLGRRAEALSLLESLAVEQPQLARAQALIGTIAMELGRPERAEAALRRAVTLDRTLEDAWSALGFACYARRRPAEALEAWQRAAEVGSRPYDALFNIGVVASQLGRRGEAAAALRRFVATAPPERYAHELSRARSLLATAGKLPDSVGD